MDVKKLEQKSSPMQWWSQELKHSEHEPTNNIQLTQLMFRTYSAEVVAEYQAYYINFKRRQINIRSTVLFFFCQFHQHKLYLLALYEVSHHPFNWNIISERLLGCLIL